MNESNYTLSNALDDYRFLSRGLSQVITDLNTERHAAFDAMFSAHEDQKSEPSAVSKASGKLEGIDFALKRLNALVDQETKKLLGEVAS